MKTITIFCPLFFVFFAFLEFSEGVRLRSYQPINSISGAFSGFANFFESKKPSAHQEGITGTKALESFAEKESDEKKETEPQTEVITKTKTEEKPEDSIEQNKAEDKNLVQTIPIGDRDNIDQDQERDDDDDDDDNDEEKDDEENDNKDMMSTENSAAVEDAKNVTDSEYNITKRDKTTSNPGDPPKRNESSTADAAPSETLDTVQQAQPQTENANKLKLDKLKDTAGSPSLVSETIRNLDAGRGPKHATLAGSLMPYSEIPPQTATNLSLELEQSIKDAESRASCNDIIHSYSSATAHEGEMGRSWLESFKSLIATSLKPINKDSDKDAVAALQSISYALEHSHTSDFETLHQLGACDVDGNGRTVLMKLIERGFLKSIQSSILWSVFSPTEYSDLINIVDKDGNNLLHLAVLSRSSTVVQAVFFALEKGLLLQEIRLYFDKPNKAGLKPIDLARRHSMPTDIYSSLLDIYRTHFHGSGAKINREVITGPPEAPLKL